MPGQSEGAWIPDQRGRNGVVSSGLDGKRSGTNTSEHYGSESNMGGRIEFGGQSAGNAWWQRDLWRLPPSVCGCDSLE